MPSDTENPPVVRWTISSEIAEPQTPFQIVIRNTDIESIEYLHDDHDEEDWEERDYDEDEDEEETTMISTEFVAGVGIPEKLMSDLQYIGDIKIYGMCKVTLNDGVNLLIPSRSRPHLPETTRVDMYRIQGNYDTFLKNCDSHMGMSGENSMFVRNTHLVYIHNMSKRNPDVKFGDLPELINVQYYYLRKRWVDLLDFKVKGD